MVDVVEYGCIRVKVPKSEERDAINYRIPLAVRPLVCDTSNINRTEGIDVITRRPTPQMGRLT